MRRLVRWIRGLCDTWLDDRGDLFTVIGKETYVTLEAYGRLTMEFDKLKAELELTC